MVHFVGTGLLQASLFRLMPPVEITTSPVDDRREERDGVGEAIQRMQRRLENRVASNSEVSPLQGAESPKSR